MPSSDAANAPTDVMNLLAEWVRLTDAGLLDEFADILDADCTLTFAGIGTVRGREAILSYMAATGKDAAKVAAAWEAGRGGKHLNMNATVAVDGSSASAQSDVLAVVFGDQGWRIVMCQRQRVTFACTDRWRITERVVEFPYDPMPEKSVAVIARAIAAANSN
jgi:hypothetical protein